MLRFGLAQAQGKGWGVFAQKMIPKSAFVCEYAGEVVCLPVDSSVRWLINRSIGTVPMKEFPTSNVGFIP
jgi:hypothetical protein